MARLILDTGVLVAGVRGRLDVAAVTDEDDVALPAVVLAEYLTGVVLDADPARQAAQRAFLAELLTVMPVEDYTPTVAEHHAALLAHVRRAGRPLRWLRLNHRGDRQGHRSTAGHYRWPGRVRRAARRAGSGAHRLIVWSRRRPVLVGRAEIVKHRKVPDVNRHQVSTHCGYGARKQVVDDPDTRMAAPVRACILTSAARDVSGHRDPVDHRKEVLQVIVLVRTGACQQLEMVSPARLARSSRKSGSACATRSRRASSDRGSQRRRVCCSGTSWATGFPLTVTMTSLPAWTRRSTPAVSLRSSRDATSDMR